MIKTVVFDLDDTLYDEIDYCKSGFKAVAESISKLISGHTVERTFDLLWKEFSSGNHTRTFNAVLEQVGIKFDEELIKQLINTYRNHKPAIKLPQDSEDVLLELKKKYTLALLTDGFLPAQKLKVQALGIEEIFSCIIYTEELGREYWKPSPAGFEKVTEGLKSRPQESVYVADNEKKDFIAPNKLGFCTIQIIRPARIHSESSDTEDTKARYVIHKISELPLLLDKL